MKLRDIFLPKYMHSDPKVRLEAVKKLNRIDLLAKIIKRDSSHDVRKAAARRMFELKKSKKKKGDEIYL